MTTLVFAAVFVKRFPQSDVAVVFEQRTLFGNQATGNPDSSVDDAVEDLDSQWENFRLFGLIYEVYPKKFELFRAWLLKKREEERQENQVHDKMEMVSM